MRGSFAGLLSAVLAFGTLVAPLHALKFNFVNVQQCDPIIFNFSGSNLSSSILPPTTLSILAANNSAIRFPVPDNFISSAGISLSFLPLAEGTTFIASLDDVMGDNVIPTSDLYRVLPSPTNSKSCLPTPQEADRHFRLLSNPSQCDDLTISYNTTSTSKAPTVRMYMPNGPSFPLNITSDNPATGRATYLTSSFRGMQVILLVDNGSGIREILPLVTVGGDSTSPDFCLTPPGSTASPISAATTPGLGSTAVIVGAAAGGSALLLVMGCMGIFVLRERRRRKRSRMLSNTRDREGMLPTSEKYGIPQLVLSQPLRTPNSTSGNPAYTVTSPTSSRYAQGSHYSRREGGLYPSPSPRRAGGPVSHSDSDNMSIQSLDIEGMLNMATLQMENNHSRKNSSVNVRTPMASPTANVLVLPPPTARPLGSKRSPRHMRDPSDVPRSPGSINPFESGGGGSRFGSGIPDSATLTNYARTPLKESMSPSSYSVGRSDTVQSGRSNYWYGVAK